nr:RecName: Full=34 kDa extracellular nuclease [Streptomyces antibioticus]
GTLIGQDYK